MNLQKSNVSSFPAHISTTKNAGRRSTPLVLHSVERETMMYPARHFCDLPVAATLRAWVPSVDAIITVTTSSERAQALREFGQIVFDRDEWRSLVTGVESERVYEEDFALFCEAKNEDPDYVLTENAALAGATPDVPQNLSIGDVLSVLGANVISLTCEHENALVDEGEQEIEYRKAG